MPNDIPWRAKFIGLANDIHMAQKQPATKIQDDPKAALHVPIEVNGIAFELIHLPEGQERFVLHCKFGVLQKATGVDVMKKVLQINHALARTHSSMFALHVQTNELIYSAPDSLKTAGPSTLLPAISKIAQSAAQWRKAKLITT